MTEPFRGSFIGGDFVASGRGDRFASTDPSKADEIVFEARADVDEVEAAVSAARAALPAWRRAGRTSRADALLRVKAALPRHAAGLAEAITAEMGKTIAESRAEVSLLGAKIDGVLAQLDSELPPAPVGAPGEQRFHALGVVGIIGPFNFPLHLVHTHLVPALLTGNTVVAKPSELTPLTGQRYAALFADAALPDGVFNLIHGLAATGAALAVHRDVRGLIFTGSYATGRHIRQATFDQPFKKVCLELGGKNPAVVLDDLLDDPAGLGFDHCVREIVLGALLTTGQRCTATSRVIAAPAIASRLRDALTEAFAAIVPGDPTLESTFMGPLAQRSARDRYLALLAAARAQGARVLVEANAIGGPSGGGIYVTPGLYEVSGDEAIVHEELFGPHVAFEVAADEDDAFRRAGSSDYGLSASLFSSRPETFERFYDEVAAGVLNFNRSTNGASGLLPFGGVGQSGNWFPAGSAAPRLCTYPVAVMAGTSAQRTANPQLDGLLAAQDSKARSTT